MTIKERAKYFFKSESAKVLFWLSVWLSEYFLLRWCMDKYSIPLSTIYSVALIICGIEIFLVAYWHERKSKIAEPLLYSLLIFQFLIFRLYKAEEFEKLFHFPLLYGRYIVIGYAVFRRFFFRGLWEKIIAITQALIENHQENVLKQNEQFIEIQNKRAERLKARNETRKIRRDHRKARWKYIFSAISGFFSGFLGLFAAIAEGISDGISDGITKKHKYHKKESTDDGASEEHKDDEPNGTIHYESNRLSLLPLMIPIMVYIALLVASLFIAKSQTLNALFSIPSETGITVNGMIEFLMSSTSVIITIVLLTAAIWNVTVQVLIFMENVKKDLAKARTNQDRSITNYVLYVITVVLLIYFFRKYYPFNIDDLAKELTSGQIIVYPLIFVFILVTITFFTNNIYTHDIKSLLAKQDTKQIWNDIVSLVLNSIKSVVSYLKLITGDFLVSIQELANEENLIDDLNLEGDHQDG